MQVIASAIIMFSVLLPSKMWYAPDQPIPVQVRGDGDTTLVLVDFMGKPIEADEPVQAGAGKTIDIKHAWPQLNTPGTYVLLAVPKGKSPSEFAGTPLVVGVRDDKRRDAPPGPIVVKVEPLRYALLSTDKGDMKIAFYYDVAPHTSAAFMGLAEGGYYDGLTFHRIVPNFVIQGGDPRGDGTGGPGYHIEAEFSSREHRPGVLSMARQGDPMEAQGAMPRPEAANSAGSQFFICLDYERTKQLDGRYTAFGQVVDGMDVVKQIGEAPTNPETQRPTTPQTIKSVRVVSVTAKDNPYAKVLNLSTVPVASPTTATTNP